MNWDARFLQRLPLFEPLRLHGGGLATTDWPSPADVQYAFDARAVASGSGRPLRVVEQGAARSRGFENRYEARLYLRGELALRNRNWHDLFNALVWLAFPQAKAAINARHYHALLAQRDQGAINRGPTQDALTLFDEGGVIVASSAPDLLDALRAFEWKRLFWRERARVMSDMRWMLFGHAIYEKALAPFVGITGRGVLLQVDAAFHALPLMAQLQALDARVAALIAAADTLKSTRELAPLPILGVPGWWPANRLETFYDDTDYFRPGRARKPSVSRAATV